MTQDRSLSTWQLGATAARAWKTFSDCPFKEPDGLAPYLWCPQNAGWVNGFLFARNRMLEEYRRAEPK